MDHKHVKFDSLSTSAGWDYLGRALWQEWMLSDPHYAMRMAKSIVRDGDTVIVALNEGEVHMFAWGAVTYSVVSKESL